LTQCSELNFLPVEKRRFPALSLAYEALREGGTMPAVLNGANEVAVAAFLSGRIGFREIHRIISKTMQRHASRHAREIGEILEVDRWARIEASSLMN
jgi:1-deoxy-D-xylulose-5-phosphate reductoisomerase